MAAFVAVAHGTLVFVKLIPQYGLVWLIGALAFCLPKPRRAAPTWIAAVLLTLAGVALMQATIASEQVSVGWAKAVDPLAAVLVCGLGCGLLVHAASFVDASRGAWPRLTSWGARLAAFSYSLYLIHLPVELVLRKIGLITRHDSLDAGSLSAYAGVAALILAVAYGFYWCAERHTATVRRWLHGRLPSTGLATARAA